MHGEHNVTFVFRVTGMLQYLLQVLRSVEMLSPFVYSLHLRDISYDQWSSSSRLSTQYQS
jgi:hypothetical protein